MPLQSAILEEEAEEVHWFEALLESNLKKLREAGQLRQLTSPAGSLANFSSNDYLGLRRHPKIVAGAISFASRYGAGSGASRVLTGTQAFQIQTEEKLAIFKGTEAALIFSSGFQVNATLIPMLVGELGGMECVRLYVDRLAHTSMYYGIRASGVRQNRYNHNNMRHLEELLIRDQDLGGRAIILTESVFSMDGDKCHLASVSALAERFGALLYVDEAHATGVYGKNGAGLCAELDPPARIVMGTLGKALGGFGAYVAGSRALINTIITRCTGFIYTTAPPPAVFGALDAALDLVPQMNAERAHLLNLAERFRRAATDTGFYCCSSNTQIVPIQLKDPMGAQKYLLDNGFDARGIRAPTVPVGKERVRFSFTANLPEESLTRLISILPGLKGFA